MSPFLKLTLFIWICLSPAFLFAGADSLNVDSTHSGKMQFEKLKFNKLNGKTFRIKRHVYGEITGKIIYMDADSLVLHTGRPERKVSVHWNDVESIEIKRSDLFGLFLTAMLFIEIPLILLFWMGSGS